MTNLPIHLYDDIVRFEDVDTAAIVYHPRYLSFIERARSQSFIDQGTSFRQLLDEGLGIVIASATMKYIRPLQLEDRFVVASQVNDFGKSIINMTQLIALDKTELSLGDLQSEMRQIPSLCFFAHIKMVVVSQHTKRPYPIPPWMMSLLQQR